MDDTISRYDALKTIGFLEAKNDKANGFSDDFDNISRTKSMIAINNLPSAQPEIIRCRDCKYADEYCHCSCVTWWNSSNDFCSRAERKTNGVS